MKKILKLTLLLMSGFAFSSSLYGIDCSNGGYAIAGTSTNALYLHSVQYDDIANRATFTRLSNTQFSSNLDRDPRTGFFWTIDRLGNALESYELSGSTIIRRSSVNLSQKLPFINMTSISPNGTVYAGYYATDSVYVIDQITGNVTNLGKIKQPGSSTKYIDLHNGDLTFDADGQMFVIGLNHENTSRSRVYKVIEGSNGLHAQSASSEILHSAALAGSNNSMGHLVVGQLQNKMLKINRFDGSLVKEYDMYLGNQPRNSLIVAELADYCMQPSENNLYTSNINIDADHCPVISDTLGDRDFEWVLEKEERIGAKLSQIDPPTLTRDNGVINSGATYFELDKTGKITSKTKDPSESNQTNIQRFLAVEDLKLKMTGLVNSLSHSVQHFGIYYYPRGTIVRIMDNNQVTFKQLFETADFKKDAELTVAIPANHYFGFYFNKGEGSNNFYYTENRFNSDGGYATAGDEQRASGLTDHFLLLDSNNGLVVATEGSALNPSTFLQGDQNYTDAVVGNVMCSDGRQIRPDLYTINSGIPQDAGDVGLESSSHTNLSQAYAIRTLIGKTNVLSRSSKSFGLTSNAPKNFKSVKLSDSSKAVNRYNSSLNGIAAFQSKSSGFNLSGGVSTSGKLMDFIPQTGPESTHGFSKTPEDIPFVSNALEAISVEYKLNDGDVAESVVFATETKNEVYNHSKGVCGLADGGILDNLTSMRIKDGYFYTAAVTNPKLNIHEVATIFSVFAKEESGVMKYYVDSKWKIEQYQGHLDADYIYNFQVTGARAWNVRSMVNSILEKFDADGDLVFESAVAPKIEAYIKSYHMRSGTLNLEIMSLNSEGQTQATLSGSEIRNDQTDSKKSGAVKSLTLKPGLNYISYTPVAGEEIFDSLFELSTPSSDAKSVIYYHRGSYSFFTDGYDNGSSQVEFSAAKCADYAEGMSDSFSQNMLGCVKMTGNLDKHVGVFRTTPREDARNYSHLVFDLKSTQEVKLCLEATAQVACTVIPKNPNGERLRIPLSSLENIDASNPAVLSQLVAVTFNLYEKASSFSIEVGNMRLENSKLKLNLVNFGHLPEALDANALFANVTEPLSLWKYENGAWSAWTNDQVVVDDWKKHFKTDVGSFSEVSPRVAYWMTSKTDLGSANNEDAEFFPELKEGWNFVGFGGSELTVAELQAKYSDNIESIWGWHDGKYVVYSAAGSIPANAKALTLVAPNHGYWVKLK